MGLSTTEVGDLVASLVGRTAGTRTYDSRPTEPSTVRKWTLFLNARERFMPSK